MNIKQAIRIATNAMQEKKKRLAVDANIVKFTGSGSPHMQKALKEYEMITEAIELLKTLEEK